jgi:IS605 OrfB family transposase
MPSKRPSEQTLQIFTFQTRIRVEAPEAEKLKSCAQLLSRIEKKLLAAISSGKKAGDLKSHYQKEYQITARHFNALRVQLEGKIASINERRIGQIIELKQKTESLQKRIEKLQKDAPHSEKLHQKKRLLFNLNCKLNKLQADHQAGKVSLCFGSRKLFRAQFDLAANQYKSHEEWKSAWQEAREDSFFLLGSKDESSGNQSCTAIVAEDHTLTLRIRLPDCLSQTHGKYLTLSGLYFKYGHAHVIKALQSCEERKRLHALKDPSASSFGLPISYRFKLDEKGWRVFVSVPVAKSPPATSSRQGVIGVDINANHLAISEIDRFGNPIAKKSIALNTYGKNQNQAKAIIGNACADIIDFAKKIGKTLIIENLDFQKKKAELKETSSPTCARMLSSLAYNQIKNHLKGRAWREGVEVVEVNPAFTSVIGRVKFSRRYGLSIHQAAALVIGRRLLKASERVPRHLEAIPDGKEGQVALSLPARNRDKHVWSTWRIISRKLKTALAVHFRAIRKNRSSSSKPALAINSIPDIVGEIPTRESVNTTARLACLDKSTALFV